MTGRGQSTGREGEGVRTSAPGGQGWRGPLVEQGTRTGNQTRAGKPNLVGELRVGRGGKKTYLNFRYRILSLARLLEVK